MEKKNQTFLIIGARCLVDERNVMAYQSNQMTRTMKGLMSMGESGASIAEHDRRSVALQEFREVRLEVAMIKVSNDNQRQGNGKC
jgi:hypothetical protein